MLGSVAFPGRIQLIQFGVAQDTLLAKGEQQRADSDRCQAHFVNRIAAWAVHHGALQALLQLQLCPGFSHSLTKHPTILPTKRPAPLLLQIVKHFREPDSGGVT